MCMTKIYINIEEPKNNTAKMPVLPFEQYIQSIEDLDKRKKFCDTCKRVVGIRSDTGLWKYRSGKTRPDILKRRELAKLIRRHSGDNSYTADNLFPEDFYHK